MNWTIADLLVGTVALALGSLGVLIAIFDVSYFYRLRKAQWFEKRWGRNSARLYYGSLGAALLFIGAIILFGKPLLM